MPSWAAGRECLVIEHDPATRTPRPEGAVLKARVACTGMNSTIHVVILGEGSLPGGLRPEFDRSGWLAAADGGLDYRWKLLEKTAGS